LTAGNGSLNKPETTPPTYFHHLRYSTAERRERSTHTVGTRDTALGLIEQAAAEGVRLEARLGGRLWADKSGQLPAALRDNLAANRPAVLRLLAEQSISGVPSPVATAPSGPPASPLTGIPLDWQQGVVRLAILPAPPTIPPRRWAVLAANSAWPWWDYGAALHGAR